MALIRDGQGTLFTHCRPDRTTTHRHGYKSHCACGWESAAERTKKYALDCLAYHMDTELKKSLKLQPEPADSRV